MADKFEFYTEHPPIVSFKSNFHRIPKKNSIFMFTHLADVTDSSAVAVFMNLFEPSIPHKHDEKMNLTLPLKKI